MTQEDINEVMANSLKRWQLEHLVFDGGNIESARRLIRLLQAENAKLKAQLTWRPVSENPENDDWVTLRRIIDGELDDEFVWFYHLKDVSDWEILVATLGATHWLPIPPAPEEKV